MSQSLNICKMLCTYKSYSSCNILVSVKLHAIVSQAMFLWCTSRASNKTMIKGDSRDPLMVSFPYYSHIFRDSYGSGMGIVREAYHKGVPLLGIPQNPTDMTSLPKIYHLASSFSTQTLQANSSTNQMKGESNNCWTHLNFDLSPTFLSFAMQMLQHQKRASQVKGRWDFVLNDWPILKPCWSMLSMFVTVFRMPIHAHLRICGDTLYSLMIRHNISKHSYWQLLLTYINIYKHHPTLFFHVLSTCHTIIPSSKQKTTQLSDNPVNSRVEGGRWSHHLQGFSTILPVVGTRVPSARDRQDEIVQHHNGFQSDQKFPSEAPANHWGGLQSATFVEPTKTVWVS